MNDYLKQFVKDKFKKPGKALDLGAGEFFDVACLEQLGWRSEGVDLKTGVDLERLHISKNKPFDLVYSNYVLHKLKSKKTLVRTIHSNLKKGGWFFIHTFDESDPNGNSSLNKASLRKFLTEEGFRNIKMKTFSYFDNDEGHRHWHKILEAVGQK